MKNKLQYAYSISVFIGVLLSSYFMMDQSENGRSPLQIFSPTSSAKKAAVVDPVVNQLFEFEKALSNQYELEDSDKLKRKPTEDRSN